MSDPQFRRGRLLSSCVRVGGFSVILAACAGRAVTPSDGNSGDSSRDVVQIDVIAPTFDIPGMRVGRGAPCTVDPQCEEGLLCASGPDLTHTCTVACSHDSNCQPENLCVVDRSMMGVRSLCSLTDPGTNEPSAVCENNLDCASNLCVSNRCRRLCANDMQCPMPARCMPTAEANGIRSCQFEPVAAPQVDERVIFTGNMPVA